MRKLSIKERAWLKIFHLLSVAAWLGGQMTLILIQSTKSQLAVPGHQYAILMSLKEIDDIIIVGGAMGCLITGFIFSLMTPWGFFKFRWVSIKWISTVSLIFFGIFFLGPWMNEMAHLSGVEYANAMFNERYLYAEKMSMVFGNIQFIIGILLTIISVLKPWGKLTGQS